MTAKADLTATVSSDPDLAEYELRACAGPDYDVDLEAVVASVPAGETPEFATDRFMEAPGAVASYRVYVLLQSGGEAGSGTVVARP